MKTTDPVDAARRTLPRRLAPVSHQAGVGDARGTIRQGGLAGGPLPGGAGRTRDRGSRSSPHRASLGQGQAAVGQTLDSFDFDAVPMVSKAQVMALTSGD